MEFGISTFGELNTEITSTKSGYLHQRMQELMTEAQLADESGIDVYALGEHHRPDYLISAPEVALTAIAAITKKIRLTSAVTVLSSADPVRVFQNFATLDIVSGGRAEIMAGRGSFIESFPLFGYNLQDYDALFSEKLDLLLKLTKGGKVSWEGKFRASLNEQEIYPASFQPSIPVWLAVGGTPASVVRAANLNLPLTLAILGTPPDHFSPLVRLYRESLKKAGNDDKPFRLAINCHMHVAEDSQQAADEFWPTYEKLMNRIGNERGWAKITRQQYDYMCSPRGSLMVGSPQDVVEKIRYQHGLFGHTRFLAQTIAGSLPHHKQLRSIELFAQKVIPEVRNL